MGCWCVALVPAMSGVDRLSVGIGTRNKLTYHTNGVCMDSQTAITGSWLELLKEKFYILMEKLNFSQESTTNIALYGGIGFLTGFVCKKASSYVFVALLVLLGIAILNQYNILCISVNWHEMSAILGIHPSEMTGDGLANIIWGAIRANTAISVSYAIGFIVGFKLG